MSCAGLSRAVTAGITTHENPAVQQDQSRNKQPMCPFTFVSTVCCGRSDFLEHDGIIAL